jgi:hypothetical protein
MSRDEEMLEESRKIREAVAPREGPDHVKLVQVAVDRLFQSAF